jgi:microsomal dipeptidase-like Zn-dependent dipeptidase
MGINLSPDFLAADYHVQWEAVMAPLRTAALGLEAEARAAARQKLREQVGPTLRAIPLPPVAWVARHVQHAIQVGGEECIGLGGDLDGVAALPAGVTGVEGYPLIVEALDAAGLTAAQVEKVCWRNMARVFVEVMA